MADATDPASGCDSPPDGGTLADTYVAALQHDLADLPPEVTLAGVVRQPTPWFAAAVDENLSALGPPEALLEETKTTAEALKMRGVCDEEAHNAAWDEVDFERRYRAHLGESGAARDALDSLANRLEGGESIALVCYENTDQKRCHRTILRGRLADAVASRT